VLIPKISLTKGMDLCRLFLCHVGSGIFAVGDPTKELVPSLLLLVLEVASFSAPGVATYLASELSTVGIVLWHFAPEPCSLARPE
jgi:hypothetical protein